MSVALPPEHDQMSVARRRVSTAPHLRLQEWPPVRISGSRADQLALARGWVQLF
jgi:hypothetical protein